MTGHVITLLQPLFRYRSPGDAESNVTVWYTGVSQQECNLYVRILIWYANDAILSQSLMRARPTTAEV